MCTRTFIYSYTQLVYDPVPVDGVEGVPRTPTHLKYTLQSSTKSTIVMRA